VTDILAYKISFLFVLVHWFTISKVLTMSKDTISYRIHDNREIIEFGAESIE
jgi:hypothetical protein